ncbi:ComEC/Rec2 family competence protein [Salinispira pacifica]|uniref:ComEC/Rec2-related protein domain-containing protein n=1 Tax=Salinispira pacifica TaxID=1307761 RepID=V5WFZ3_9SPIO|nr:ComEC/Rec2 family competence protein [Salinispira pacifica]AHC14525.1 hypothetical protein L21SP2_1122 [Salinispira pacifica]
MFLLELTAYAALYRRLSDASEPVLWISPWLILFAGVLFLAVSQLLSRISSSHPGRFPETGSHLPSRAAWTVSTLLTLWIFAGLSTGNTLIPRFPGQASNLSSDLSSDASSVSAREIRVQGRVDADSRLDYRGRTIHSMHNLILTMENGSSFSRPGSIIFEIPGERFFMGERLEIQFTASARDLARLPLPAGTVELLSTGTQWGNPGAQVADPPAQDPETAGEGLARETPAITATAVTATATAVKAAAEAGLALRRKIRIRILEGLQLLDNPGRAFVQSLVLGYRSGLPGIFSTVFRQAGVMHILVLSGMHLVLLYAGVLRLLPGFCPAVLREIIALVTIFLYLGLINPGTSAFRAAGAIFCYSAATMAGVRLRPVLLLRLIWTGLILIRPVSLLDPGMYLSFAAVWGLMNFRAPFVFLAAGLRWRITRRRNGGAAPGRNGENTDMTDGAAVRNPLRRLLQWAGEMLASSLAAQTAVMPLALLLFSGFSPHSWIVLPLVIIPFYLLFAVSVCAIPLLLVLPSAAAGLDALLQVIIGAMHALLFPFHLLGAGLNEASRWLKLVGVSCFLGIPLSWQFYCVKHALLVSSSHVQLRFSKGYPGASLQPGYCHAKTLRSELHDQSGHEKEGGGLPSSC